MHKTILSLVGCSGSIATVLATGMVANPDTAKTIPYPEVMNLTRVPRFNASGIVPTSQIATVLQPQQPILARKKVVTDPVGQTLRELQLMRKYGIACASCRNLAPTVMVMGYSSPGVL